MLKLLRDQLPVDKANYYERFYVKSNKENADFLARISFRLSQAMHLLTIEKVGAKDFKEAHRLIQKAI